MHQQLYHVTSKWFTAILQHKYNSLKKNTEVNITGISQVVSLNY